MDITNPSPPSFILNDYNRIIAVPQRALHVFVGVPVIFPLGIIDEITKLIFLSRLTFERDLVVSIFLPFHGIGTGVPIVEITNDTYTLCTRGSHAW
jgi:hypothetical protein